MNTKFNKPTLLFLIGFLVGLTQATKAQISYTIENLVKL